MPVNLSFTVPPGKGNCFVRPSINRRNVARCGCAAAGVSLCVAGSGRVTGAFKENDWRQDDISKASHDSAASCCKHQVSRVCRPYKRAKTFSEFGAPQRRITDILLIFNAVMFAAQLLTKQKLTAAGIKVLRCPKPSTDFCLDACLGSKCAFMYHATHTHSPDCHTTCLIPQAVLEMHFTVLQSNAAIVQGQWWRLVTPAFLHGSLVHLAVNSFSLHNLGPLLETFTGHKRFATVYAAAAVAGCVASFYGAPAKFSLGASGGRCPSCNYEHLLHLYHKITTSKNCLMSSHNRLLQLSIPSCSLGIHLNCRTIISTYCPMISQDHLMQLACNPQYSAAYLCNFGI